MCRGGFEIRTCIRAHLLAAGPRARGAGTTAAAGFNMHHGAFLSWSRAFYDVECFQFLFTIDSGT